NCKLLCCVQLLQLNGAEGCAVLAAPVEHHRQVAMSQSHLTQLVGHRDREGAEHESRAECSSTTPTTLPKVAQEACTHTHTHTTTHTHGEERERGRQEVSVAQANPRESISAAAPRPEHN